MRLSPYALALAACAALACSPGDRGWCRRPADYRPAGPSEPVAAGAIAVMPPASGAGRFFGELLASDLSYAGYFSSAKAEEGGAAVFTLMAGEPELEYLAEGGACRVLEARAGLKLMKGGRLLLDKEYGRSWAPELAPSCDEAWERELPAVMQEMRRDTLAAARRSAD